MTVSCTLHFDFTGGVDWKRCILCLQDAGQLVLEPRLDSYHTLLAAVKEQVSLHDGKFFQIQKRLEDCTTETLQRNKALWRRTCYSNTTSEVKMQCFQVPAVVAGCIDSKNCSDQ